MSLTHLEPTVDAVAAEHDFGDRLTTMDTYPSADGKSRIGCAAVPLVLGVVLLVVGLVIGGFWGIVLPFAAGVLGLWFLIALIPGLIELSRSGKYGAFLYRNGLVLAGAGQVSQVIDLRQSRVTESVVQHYRNGRKAGPAQVTFAMDGPHGSTQLKGSGSFIHHGLPVVKQTAAEARLPMVTEALNRGEEVPFGKVTLAGTGFRVNNAEIIPYTEISELSAQAGAFTIKYGTVNLQEHAQLIGETPDFAVLSALLATWSGRTWT